MKNYTPWEPKAPTRLESKADGGDIMVTMVCPDSRGCASKKELKCRYSEGKVIHYNDAKFPAGDAIITALGCGEKFTIGRDKKGFYIELGDTKSR